MALPAGLENQSFCFVQVGDAVLGWPSRVLYWQGLFLAIRQQMNIFLLTTRGGNYLTQLIIHHGGVWPGFWVMMLPSLCWVMAGKVCFISVSNEIVNCYVFCCVLCQTSKTSTTSVNKEGGNRAGRRIDTKPSAALRLTWYIIIKKVWNYHWIFSVMILAWKVEPAQQC